MLSIQEAEKLVGELESKNLNTRSRAIEVLSSLEKMEIIDFLISLLMKNSHRLVKEGVCKSLGKIGHRKATDVLIETLNDENESVRYQAVIALGQLGDSHAVPPLLELLKRQDDPLVRSEAAKALGLIGDPSALKILLNILKKEDDRFIKYHTVTSLGKIGDKKAIRDLQKIVKKKKDHRLVLRSMEAIEAIQKANSKKVVAG
ncbi:MAG: HEAT repeat domain-containing protein [Candidatus Heimdallarchaeota archaeon]